MIRRILYVILILGVFSWIAYSLLSNSTNLLGKSEDPFRVIPGNSSLVFEINDFSKLREKTNLLPYQQNIENLPFIEELHKKHDFLYSIFGEPVAQKVLMVAHLINAEKFDFIYVFDFSDKDFNPIVKIRSSVDSTKYVFKEGQFKKHQTYKVLSGVGNQAFHFYYKDGLLLGSFSEFLLEEGINEWDTQKANLEEDEQFVKVKGLANRNADATIYLNYEKFPFMVNGITKDDIKNELEFLKDIGTWCSLDMSLGENSLYFTGYSLFNDSLPHLLSEMKEQKPQAFKMYKVLPSNTALMLWLGVSEVEGILGAEVSEMHAQLLGQLIDSELALVYLDNYNYKTKSGMLASFKLQQSPLIQDQIDIVSNLLDSSSFSYPIYQFKKMNGMDVSSKMFKGLYHNMFDKFTPRFFTVVNGYILIANTMSTIKSYLYKIDNKDLLGRNIEFLKFQENLSSEANIIVYQNTGKAYNVLYPLVDNNIKDDFPSYYSELKKFYHLGIELTNFNEKFFTNVSVLYDRSEIERNVLSWEMELDAPMASKPTFVKNHKTKANEIVVQDSENTIYLISMEGKVLWKRSLDAPILGEVQQVDIYDNNKLQLIFNTRDKIYVVDRNGNYVENYPIQLEAYASSPLFVIDYEGKKDYRYFISCTDGKMYGYKKSGKMLSKTKSSWPKKVGEVKLPIKFMTVAGKDYFIVTNTKGNVYLLNRKGEERIPKVNLGAGFNNSFSADFSKDPYVLVAGGKDKKVYSFDLKGNVAHYECLNLDVNPTPEMHFVDLDGNSVKDYIYVSDQSIVGVGQDSSIVFDVKFTDPIDPNIQFIKKGRAYHVGVFGRNNGELYMIDNKGSIVDGFPVKGYKEFDYLNNGNGIQIVSGSEIGKLYLYSIKD